MQNIADRLICLQAIDLEPAFVDIEDLWQSYVHQTSSQIQHYIQALGVCLFKQCIGQSMDCLELLYLQQFWLRSSGTDLYCFVLLCLTESCIVRSLP